MASLPQWPRSEEEELNFRRALKNMGDLYFLFDVLVVDWLPAELTLHGHHVPYYEKGWCFTEANIANMGDRLQRFNADIDLRISLSTRDAEVCIDRLLMELHGQPA